MNDYLLVELTIYGLPTLATRVRFIAPIRRSAFGLRLPFAPILTSLLLTCTSFYFFRFAELVPSYYCNPSPCNETCILTICLGYWCGNSESAVLGLILWFANYIEMPFEDLPEVLIWSASTYTAPLCYAEKLNYFASIAFNSTWPDVGIHSPTLTSWSVDCSVE